MQMAGVCFRLSCYPQGKRYVHTVSEQQLTCYIDSLRRFKSRAYVFQNIALCKLRGKDQPTILTNKWPNFSCTAMLQHWTSTLHFPTRNQRTCRLLLLSDSEDDFANFMHDSKLLQEEAVITAIDSVTNGYLDRVAKTMFPQWQGTTGYSYKTYYLADNIEDTPSRYCFDEYFIDKLSLDHTDFIAEHADIKIFYTVTKKQTSRYFKHLLTTYKMSAAAFMKSNPTYPVAWFMYCDYGLAAYQMTLPEHRHKGLAMAICDNLFAQMQRQGIVAISERYLFNPPTNREYVLESTWRDSITGECYW